MPTVFRQNGFRFFFFANEGDPREPLHVHVERGDSEAKFWVKPAVALAYNDGFDARTLRHVALMVEVNAKRIERVWDGFFGQGDLGTL